MKNDTLGLYGPEDSKYLRLVARRAEVEVITGGLGGRAHARLRGLCSRHGFRVADVGPDPRGGRGLYPAHGPVLLCDWGVVVYAVHLQPAM